MKRFTLLALIVAMVLGFTSFAGATELKARGEFQVHADWADNLDFIQSEDGDNQEDDFQVQQRMRVWFDFIANENLKAVLGIEIGTTFWGDAATGAGLDTDGRFIETKHAYLDFNVPGSTVNVKAGLIPITFPNAFGSSAITDHDSAGLVVSTPITDMFSVTAGWTRVNDRNDTATGNEEVSRIEEEIDIFLLALPITPKGMSIVPWVSYAIAGEDTIGATAGPTGNIAGIAGLAAPVTAADDLKAADVWWAGLAFTLNMFDPFVFAFDINYGTAQEDESEFDRSGWLVDLRVDYKGWAFAKPSLFAAYSTGENDEGYEAAGGDGKSERMPFILEGWSIPGSFFHGGSAFDAENGHGSDRNKVAFIGNGFWVVGAGLYGITFVDKLKHDLVVAYTRGTNDENSVALLNNTRITDSTSSAVGQMLTNEDAIWEVNFNHQYQIYEQLAAILELGWMHADYDEDTWSAVQANVDELSDAWRVLLGLKYRF